MKQAFTLIELLVVVLIIGILAAIALPQYQKAVLKSRYTTLMPIAKGIAEGNEAYFMEHGVYAEDPTELPIKGQESYPDGTELRVVDDTDKDVSYVIATRPKLMPNNKYIVFQKHSGKFSDVTLCEATSDPLATWLCKDALKGQVVEGNSLSGTGWTSYALSGDTTGSSFASALEQVAEGIKTQNSNYEVASIDEENGTITMCDINYATVGTDGKCVSAGKGVNCRSTSRFGYSNTYCDPYQIAYDEDGKVVGKTSCTNSYGCSGNSGVYVEEDESGEISYLSARWGVAKAVYENGSYTGTNYIMINPDNSTEQYYYDIDGNGHWLRSCSNGADFNNAVCNP